MQILKSCSSYSQLELTEDQQDLIDRVSVLAREKFAPRAAEYDRTATFPAEDFDDLFRAGLLAPVVPKEHGGLWPWSIHRRRLHTLDDDQRDRTRRSFARALLGRPRQLARAARRYEHRRTKDALVQGRSRTRREVGRVEW